MANAFGANSALPVRKCEGTGDGVTLGGTTWRNGGCGVEGALGRWSDRGMFAVGGGGPAPTLGDAFRAFCELLDGVSTFFGLGDGFTGGTPPYFSNSSWVELYLVAALSLSIVLARSDCWSSKRCVALSIR